MKFTKHLDENLLQAKLSLKSKISLNERGIGTKNVALTTKILPRIIAFP